MWGRRALERRGRETSGSLEQRKRPTMREDRRPHRPEPERLTARIEALRSRRSQALSLRRSLWRTCSDTVCASSRNGCLLDARNTSGGVYPGGGVEE